MTPVPRTPIRRRTIALLVAALVMGSCAGPSGAETTTVRVAAAASLTDVFATVEDTFEAEHPGLDVVLSLAGSSALREQVLGGAPLDVLATADLRTMEAVVDAGRSMGEPVVFATNRLALAVPAGNPGGLESLDDLAEEALFVGVCAPQVPCGALAQRELDAAGIAVAPDTEEPNVRSLLAKVAEGELDAGLVYATDVAAAAPDVVGIELTSRATSRYPIARLEQAPNPDGAAAFVEFVLSDTGRSLLADAGFGAP